METDSNEQNPSGGQGSKTRGGLVGDDRAKGADFSEEQEAGGALGDDRAKGVDSSSESGAARARGGLVSDDRAKDFGGPQDHPKG